MLTLGKPIGQRLPRADPVTEAPSRRPRRCSAGSLPFAALGAAASAGCAAFWPRRLATDATADAKLDMGNDENVVEILFNSWFFLMFFSGIHIDTNEGS